MIGTWTNILAADDIQRQLEFVRVPSGWAGIASIAVLVLILYAVIFFYRREQRSGVSVRARTTLAVMRCLVILTLAAIWLEPVLATYIHRRIEATTLVLIDGSASMSVRDAYPNAIDAERIHLVIPDGNDAATMSRVEILEAALNRDDSNLLKQLATNNRVEMYRFGESLTRLGQYRSDNTLETEPLPEPTADDQPAGLTFDATEGATDVGKAIRNAIEAQSGTPIAAVVVFSDGQFNQGEPTEVVGSYARSKKVPIHLVGVGDPAEPRNTTIASIEAPPNVFVKDPFKVTVNVRTQGLDGSTLKVDLLERFADAETAIPVDTRNVIVKPGGQVEPLVFSRSIGRSAEVRLTARVEVQAGETFTDDNTREVTVRALENKMRVLLVAGSPSWEYRYLMRMLQRDETVDLSCWLQSADVEAVRDGNTVIDHFPTTDEDLFVYDCVILLDPQPTGFDPAWTTHLEQMVGNNGSGLVYVAGRKHAQQFMHNANTQSLVDLLPVVIDTSDADIIINEMGHFQTTAWPLSVAAEAASHPVLALTGEAGANAQLWANLPGVYWHYPTRRAKPVASVLLTHSNPRMRNSSGQHVLLATQYYGAGRTAYLGFDTTWRWRRLGNQYFNKFWIQMLRHIVEGKLLSGQKRGMIQMERDRYAVGEPVRIEARLLDSRNMPLERNEIDALLQVDNRSERQITLKPQVNRPGWYQARFVVTETGRHQLRIDLPSEDGSDRAVIRSEFSVGRGDLEFRRTELNRDAMKALASASDHGQYFEIDELEQLAAAVPSRTKSLVLDGTPISLWDRWWTLAILVGLLTTEWIARKRARLL